VISGSHCLSRFSMWATLIAAISHALWHDVWTNAVHDDQDFCIARMLVWQEIRMRAGADLPFAGRDLYSLLMMGMLPLILQSIPFSTLVSGEGSGDETEGKKDAEAEHKCRLETYDPLQEAEHDMGPFDAFLNAVRHDMV
jgi:hypothetical protein